MKRSIVYTSSSSSFVHLIVSLCLLVLVFSNLFTTVHTLKHHNRKSSTCPVVKKCPVHTHKICGSDGQLYSSHCHLRKAACEKGVVLRAVHADQCVSEEYSDAIDTSDHKSPEGDEESTENTGQQCTPKLYDAMKEQLLLKTNDGSLLFNQVDTNSDGTISMNELWAKSGVFRVESACMITDMLQHEDRNHDQMLDFQEFQTAFSNLYTISMVTLDQNLAVNYIQARVGDNVEIRCDISGKPQPPVILWSRRDVNLATVNIPNMKVFNDGSLYLTDVQLSFTGNYTCQAETNSAIKQTHILRVVVPPVVNTHPPFVWSPVGGVATIECHYDSMESGSIVEWLKNDEVITSNMRTSIMNNGTKLQIADVVPSDTGAYTCRVRNSDDTAVNQDISSLLVQDEPISASSHYDREKLWLFHGNGVSIYSEGCKGLLHEIDTRDIIPLNGLALCGRSENDARLCEWGPNAIQIDNKIYISQPNLNRIIVFHSKQLNVIQLITTDPQPRELHVIKSKTNEWRIWILCHGSLMNSKKIIDFNQRRESMSLYEEMLEDPEYQWHSPSKEQQRHNRKTVQIIRISSQDKDDSSVNNENNNINSNTHLINGGSNVIHLQPIDGHFDLVYDLFVPNLSPVQSQQFYSGNKYAYTTHWDERAVVKIDMEQFKYIKTINLAECQPISAVFTDYGLVIIQCQTPITHQLNGQLVLDQLTDSIITFNGHIRGHKSFLSPNQRFLINIFSNETNSGITSTTVIVQQVNENGVTFLYDVRTTLNIVNCNFVWKNGNYDAILASGTANREDLLYLSLTQGKVELISGIGRPTGGSTRGMAVSSHSRMGAVTSLESVFVVDLTANRVQCESQQRHQNPSTLHWS